MKRAFIPKVIENSSQAFHLTRVQLIRKSICKYLNRYPELRDDWRAKPQYTGYSSRRYLWIDNTGNVIEVNDDSIIINKVDISFEKLAELYPDIDLINYKLSLFFSGVHFGKKSPYSKRSSNYFAIRALVNLIKRYNINIDLDNDWPHTLGKLIESSKRYLGVYKSIYTTDQIFKNKNLKLEFQAVFVRIYLEHRAGSANCMSRFRVKRLTPNADLTNLDRNKLLLRSGLKIKSSYRHLNSLRKSLGLIPYPADYFDFSSIKFYEKEFDNTEYPGDNELISIIRSFYYNQHSSEIRINMKQLEYILKRFYYGFWKNNHTVDTIDRDELTPFEELATKINNWKECGCYVTF